MIPPKMFKQQFLFFFDIFSLRNDFKPKNNYLESKKLYNSQYTEKNYFYLLDYVTDIVIIYQI